MRLALLVLAGSMSACGNAGDPPEPPEQLLTITPSGDGLEVSVENGFLRYAMRFASGDLKMPDRLSVRETENILGFDVDECNKESLIGVAVFPALVGTANTQAQNASSELRVLLDHPAVATISVNYTLPYLCPSEQQLVGESVFTFFASGRIVRHDVVTPSTTNLMVPSPGNTQDCGCQTAAGGNPQGENDVFFFTSYWAFAPETPPGVDAAGQPTGGGSNGACTMSSAYSVAVNWSDSTTRVGPNTAAAHVFDFENGVPMLSNMSRDVFSAIQLDATMDRPDTDCGPLLDQLAVRPLFIDGVDHTTDEDGIFRDNVTHEERFLIESRTEFIPPGFAVALDLGGATHAEITPSTPFVKPPIIKEAQPGSPVFLFYFQDPLPPGQSIAIEPL